MIDDFWHNPAELRRNALAAPFTHKLSASGFAFHDCKAEWRHTVRMAELVARAAGASLLQGRFESRFVYETALDEAETRRRVWVHYDRWIRVGVLYLSDLSISPAGTGFYRHRPTGFTTVDQADASGLRPVIMRDSTIASRWELVDQVALRFNRLVLFRPTIFHQALAYFGSTVADSRLYSIIAFEGSPSVQGGSE